MATAKKTIKKLPRKSTEIKSTRVPKTAEKISATVYTQDGKKGGDVSLPGAVFGAKWNPDLVHEVVISMQSNARAGTANTKGRGEVRGGGKKPWKQKGTGRARHGSRRSPIWRGGGITHGPLSEKDYGKKINKKVRRQALISTLSKKQSDGEIIFVEALKFDAPKTAVAKTVIAALAKGSGKTDLVTRQNAALIVLPARSEAAEKSFRNFGNFATVQAKDVNPVDLLSYKYVVVADPAASVEAFLKRIKN